MRMVITLIFAALAASAVLVAKAWDAARVPIKARVRSR